MQNTKKTLAITLSIALLLLIAFYSYRLSMPETNSYIGMSQDNLKMQNSTNTQIETIVGADGQSKNIKVVSDPSFNPRSFTGGGDKPTGWLVSVTETQPNVFTGKLLYNLGLDTYNLFMQEQDGFFTGEAKSVKDKSIKDMSMQKQNTLCKDSEGNTYEYTLLAYFDGANLTGCGGTVIEVKK